MLKIDIIAVGKMSHPFLSDGCTEYLKRIAPYYQLSVIEVAEEKQRGEGGAEVARILKHEGERLLRLIGKRKGLTVALAVEGARISSEQFAAFLDDVSDHASQISFLIGGSYGLSDDVKQRADRLISLSDMTFPHQIARMLLTEQLYRAATINNGIKSHK